MKLLRILALAAVALAAQAQNIAAGPSIFALNINSARINQMRAMLPLAGPTLKPNVQVWVYDQVPRETDGEVIRYLVEIQWVSEKGVESRSQFVSASGQTALAWFDVDAAGEVTYQVYLLVAPAARGRAE